MLAVFSTFAVAQSTLTVEADKGPRAVAVGNNLYCAGYIQTSAIAEGNYIVGSNDEAHQFQYAGNDFMYINMGSNKGVNVGDVFAVVRPRAQFKSKWSDKGNLGFYVQEVGALEVVKVKPEVSVARIKASCDVFYLGDLVQPIEKRISPPVEVRPVIDIFADYSGKAIGRIVMARDMPDLITRDFIVYVDLGADDNVKVGDRLTVFRPLGSGGVYKGPQNETITARDYGFESEDYKGGKFSNQAPRKSGSHAGGHEVTPDDARRGRPSNLRKIVGEAVILNVKEKTATVVITRTAAEIHPGDYVEVQ